MIDGNLAALNRFLAEWDAADLEEAAFEDEAERFVDKTLSPGWVIEAVGEKPELTDTLIEIAKGDGKPSMLTKLRDGIRQYVIDANHDEIMDAICVEPDWDAMYEYEKDRRMFDEQD